jgi:hypothetical protein
MFGDLWTSVAESLQMIHIISSTWEYITQRKHCRPKRIPTTGSRNTKGDAALRANRDEA